MYWIWVNWQRFWRSEHVFITTLIESLDNKFTGGSRQTRFAYETEETSAKKSEQIIIIQIVEVFEYKWNIYHSS